MPYARRSALGGAAWGLGFAGAARDDFRAASCLTAAFLADGFLAADFGALLLGFTPFAAVLFVAAFLATMSFAALLTAALLRTVRFSAAFFGAGFLFGVAFLGASFLLGGFLAVFLAVLGAGSSAAALLFALFGTDFLAAAFLGRFVSAFFAGFLAVSFAAFRVVFLPLFLGGPFFAPAPDALALDAGLLADRFLAAAPRVAALRFFAMVRITSSRRRCIGGRVMDACSP
ncbi:MAG TPA: hypothetical protein VM492_06200, partial [Sumerlaeia bacterium]|nr:hypothetical protein [Sumerlaeia bacterium]